MNARDLDIQLAKAVTEDDVKLAKALLQQGANPCFKTKNGIGNTFGHYLVPIIFLVESPAMLSLLLESGANPDEQGFVINSDLDFGNDDILMSLNKLAIIPFQQIIPDLLQSVFNFHPDNLAALLHGGNWLNGVSLLKYFLVFKKFELAISLINYERYLVPNHLINKGLITMIHVYQRDILDDANFDWNSAEGKTILALIHAAVNLQEDVCANEIVDDCFKSLEQKVKGFNPFSGINDFLLGTNGGNEPRKEIKNFYTNPLSFALDLKMDNLVKLMLNNNFILLENLTHNRNYEEGTEQFQNIYHEVALVKFFESLCQWQLFLLACRYDKTSTLFNIPADIFLQIIKPIVNLYLVDESDLQSYMNYIRDNVFLADIMMDFKQMYTLLRAERSYGNYTFVQNNSHLSSSSLYYLASEQVLHDGKDEIARKCLTAANEQLVHKKSTIYHSGNAYPRLLFSQVQESTETSAELTEGKNPESPSPNQ